MNMGGREHKRSVYSRGDLGHHLRLADAELRQRRSSACLQSCRLLELVLGDHHTTIQSSSLLLSHQTSQIIAGSKQTHTSSVFTFNVFPGLCFPPPEEWHLVSPVHLEGGDSDIPSTLVHGPAWCHTRASGSGCTDPANVKYF